MITNDYQDFKSVFEEDSMTMFEHDNDISEDTCNFNTSRNIKERETLEIPTATESSAKKKYGKSNARSKLQLEKINLKNIHSYRNTIIENSNNLSSNAIANKSQNVSNDERSKTFNE